MEKYDDKVERIRTLGNRLLRDLLQEFVGKNLNFELEPVFSFSKFQFSRSEYVIAKEQRLHAGLIANEVCEWIQEQLTNVPIDLEIHVQSHKVKFVSGTGLAIYFRAYGEDATSRGRKQFLGIF